MENDAHRYRLEIRGHLQRDWANWLSNARTQYTEETTVIVGDIVDQSQLQGLLRYIGNLGVDLIALQQIDDKPD